MARTTAISSGHTGVPYQNYQRFHMKPANAFEWKRYTEEEKLRQGDKSSLNANETSRKRSEASSKAVERNRLTNNQANIGYMSFHKVDEATPAKFNIYDGKKK